MKLKNSTNWNDDFLRRVVSWCCDTLEVGKRTVRIASFRNSRSLWGGRAMYWRGQISVCVSPNESDFPVKGNFHYRENAEFADRTECLVAVTAHEIYHLAAHDRKSGHYQSTRGGSRGSSERATCAAEWRTLEAFRENRESLLADWSQTKQPLKPAESIVDKRAKKAAADLLRWQRKLKFAQSKVRKYLKKIRYYEKKMPTAACPEKGSVP